MYNPVTSAELTLLWHFKQQEEKLGSKRIKLFLSFCLFHFYGDQNKDMREESEAQSKISSSSTCILALSEFFLLHEADQKEEDEYFAMLQV